MSKTYTTIDTDLGELTLTATDEVLTGIYQENQMNLPSKEELGDRVDPEAFEEVAIELKEYFDGKRKDFTFFALKEGSEFQKQVWHTVDEIPYGETVTYKELAEMMGRPESVRAIAGAVGKNPLTIVVPCHRVVGSDGKENYSGGVTHKRYLLDLEQKNK